MPKRHPLLYLLKDSIRTPPHREPVKVLNQDDFLDNFQYWKC